MTNRERLNSMSNEELAHIICDVMIDKGYLNLLDWLEEEAEVKMIYNLESFMEGKFVVNCKTKKEAEAFLFLLEKQGCNWRAEDGRLTKSPCWEEYYYKTCYRCCEPLEKQISYCSTDYYSDKSFDVIPYQAFKQLLEA